MRIHLKIYSGNKIIPFNHQHLLVGTIHKWLGWNNEHGKLSFFSFSRLDGGLCESEGLYFSNGATLFFSSYNKELIKKMIKGIQIDPSLFLGLRVNEIVLEEEPDFSDKEVFWAASPILIKRRVGDKIDHILYDDERASQCLKETLLHKMAEAGLPEDSIDIFFDRSYHKAQTQKITYRGVENRASMCPVIIKGSPQTKAFAWNVGLGNSTGIGFGAIK